MRATWRPLATWPYPPRAKQSGTFPSGWDAALNKLEEEIERLKGDDPIIGLVLDPAFISMSGSLKAGWTSKHPGVEVSFGLPDGRRLTFYTDAYKLVRYNVRAIALGMEALRAVDRYGITSSAEQYAGFAALPPGGPDPARGERLVAAAGGIREAEKRHHPDAGGDQRDFVDVQAYKTTLAIAGRL